MVFVIFLALIFMVRFVLNSSRVYVEKSTVIHPYMIEWPVERDGSLRINEPYFLKTDARLIMSDRHEEPVDSGLFTETDSAARLTVRDLKIPFLIWKNAGSDTIHVLKNNTPLNFLVTEK